MNMNDNKQGVGISPSELTDILDKATKLDEAEARRMLTGKAESMNKMKRIAKLEEKLGIDAELLLTALAKGIWLRENLHYANTACRQRYPFTRIRPFRAHDGEAMLRITYWDLTCCEDRETSVRVRDYGKTWSVRKKDVMK